MNLNFFSTYSWNLQIFCGIFGKKNYHSINFIIFVQDYRDYRV